LNILSADIATDSKRVTAVFRLAAMPADSSKMDQGSPGGREFQFTFTYLAPPAAGTTTPVQKSVTLTATQSPLGNKFQDGLGTGAFYPTSKQIHITVPFSALDISLKKGTVLSGLRAQSGRIVDTPGPLVALGPADLATSSKTYKAGYRSCIKVGA
jgi:hypothetical protein